jgi:hypothetical protein
MLKLWLLRDNNRMAEGIVQDQNQAGYPDHFSFPGLPEHFSLLNKAIPGLIGMPVKIHFGSDEDGFLVKHDGTQYENIQKAAFEAGASEIVHHSGNINLLVNTSGEFYQGEGFNHGAHLQDAYVQMPSGHRFQLHIGSELAKADLKPFEVLSSHKKKRAHAEVHPHHYGIIFGINVFHAMHEDHDKLAGLHIKSPDDKKFEESVEKAKDQSEPAIVIHGDAPPMLREEAPAAPHPHAYDWHDGHTAHYGGDSVGAMEKCECAEGSTQDIGSSVNYRPIAEHYGSIVGDQHPSNLKFYSGLAKAAEKIENLLIEEGYVPFYADGDSGKPDLAKKNYDTKDLLIWNTCDEEAMAWRKLHELAHALTHEEINELHGEGKRVGKLGERSPREAKRSVHWEWLAAHKQRELAKQAGVKIEDEDFAREVNTIMADAVHRAITGQYVQGNKEGFVPSKEPAPLEVALNLIDEHAHRAGLNHEEATFLTTGVPKDVEQNYQIMKSEGLSGELKQGGKIKKFFLWREQDESGVSGTGRVAEGVIFSNGWVGMNWLTRWGSLAFYPSINDCLTVHGHQGKTKVVYEDCEPGSEHMIALPAAAPDVKKAFLQGDGETLTDPKSHDAANQAVHPSLMDWGVKNLVPMAIDHQGEFELAGKVIKVRKVLEDLYSGWVEHENKIIHQFEKITLPLVLSQLQSKLELYGKEEDAVSDKPIDPGSVTGPMDIGSKIKELQEKLKEQLQAVEIKETLSGTDLAPGIENPEKECAACERPSDQCVCYLNLPVPRVEVTPKGVNIFFKSEWNEEDIQNFKSDLCRRAGLVLTRRRIESARSAIDSIRSKIKK